MNNHPLSACTLMADVNLTRRNLLKYGALGLFAPAWLTGCGGSDASLIYSTTIADARSAILKAMADSSTPSVSVALIERDRLVWAEAFGTIDKAAGTPAATETLFCMGSCSKMLTTIAVMILVDRGLIELDQPVVRYLPEFRMASPEYTRVTVRMLLSHSSGFPGSDYRGAFRTDPASGYAAQVMQTLSTAQLKHAPGEMSVYCNDGFTMIEPLIEAVCGKSLPRFVTDEILVPLGMTRSCYALEPFSAGSYAPWYEGNSKQGQEFTLAYASGGLYTTPTEIAQLARMLLNGGVLEGKRLLSVASIAEMAKNQTVTNTLRPVAMADGYGLGWDGVRDGAFAAVGVTAWHKGGDTVLFHSHFVLLPDEGLALFITGTSSAYAPSVLCERILLQALIERNRLAAMPSAVPETILPESPATDAQLAAIAGIYANGSTLIRLDPQVDGSVAGSIYAAGKWAPLPSVLKRRVDGSYSSDAVPNNAFLAVTAKGEDYLCVRQPRGLGHYLLEFPYVQKLAALPPLSAAWQARLGLKWLAVNEPANSIALHTGLPVFTVAAVPDLPGYIVASAGVIEKTNQIADASTDDMIARMCLKIAWMAGRDLDDVVILPRQGQEWVRVGSSVFRPQTSVVQLASGVNTVGIGAEGYAEWRSIAASARAQTITISGADAWKLYDKDFALLASSASASQAVLPAGTDKSCLLLYGSTGVSIGVTLS